MQPWWTKETHILTLPFDNFLHYFFFNTVLTIAFFYGLFCVSQGLQVYFRSVSWAAGPQELKRDIWPEKHLQLPLWNTWSTKRQNYDLATCAWACITLLTHFLFQRCLDEFYFLRWIPVNSTSSLCWVLCNSTYSFWGTYEITLHSSRWLIPALTWTIRNSETVLCAMNIRWINARGIFKRPLKLQTVYSHKFPCDQRWHKSSFSCFRGKKQ